MKYALKEFPWGSHAIVAQMLYEEKAKNILDLGCSEGFLAKALRYKPKLLVGVDNQIGKKPKGYDKFIKADIEKKFKVETTFDGIVMADILEHLEKPDFVLRKFKNNIKRNGVVIVSVPNMNFLPVKILINLGVRPKMDRGFFDRTHIQDFNLKSITKLLEDNQWGVVNILYSPVPLPLISGLFNRGEILYPLYSLLAKLTNLFPSHFAYQIIIKAKNK